jgi:hypothetical protein
MKDLLEKVTKMRELQKKYFSGRDHLVLRAAKAAEKEVDAIILEHAIAKKDTQKSLF